MRGRPRRHGPVCDPAPVSDPHEVLAVLSRSDELMRLASKGIFSLRYPDHPLSGLHRHVADRLLKGARAA